MAPPTLNAVIGSNLRRLREQAGTTQDELSRRLRRWGLPWKRPTVAAVELGTKTLDIGELVLLSLALNVQVDALLAGDGRARIRGDATPALWVVRAVLTGDKKALKSMTLGDVGIPSALAEAGKLLQTTVGAMRTLSELPPDMSDEDFETAVNAAGGEAEQASARKLRCSPLDLSFAAFRLWGRSLADERDDRVAEATVGASGQRAIQAHRGHVTRKLLEELEPILRRES